MFRSDSKIATQTLPASAPTANDVLVRASTTNADPTTNGSR